MPLWSIAVLLVGGIAAGMLFPGRFTQLFGDAALYVFLPALIFEASWQLHAQDVRRMWRPIVLLAVPGVVLTGAIVALGVHYLAGAPWPPALLLGAILSATDPVAVTAIFRRLRMPRALSTIVESESLLNDAAAVVMYRSVIAATAIAGARGLFGVSAQAIFGVAFGIGLGALFGYGAAAVFRRSTNTLLLGALTVAGAFGAYYVAGRFAWSGLFAVIAFAIVLRAILRRRVGERCAPAVDSMWGAFATAANAALFFLIGAALDLGRLAPALAVAVITLASVMVARLALGSGLLRLSRPQLPRAWRAVVNLAGMRGALSLALALATPLQFAFRSVVVDTTFFVVVVTLLLGTLTLSHAIGRLSPAELPITPVP